MNLDRFSQGLSDPQDVKPIAYCDICRCEIYPGGELYKINGNYNCGSKDCILQAVDAESFEARCDICDEDITDGIIHNIHGIIVCDKWPCLLEATGVVVYSDN